VARMEKDTKVYKVLVGKPEGKRPLGRPRRRRKDGIRMDLWEIGWGVDWIRLAQDRDRWRAFVNTVMNLRVLVLRSWLLQYDFTWVQFSERHTLELLCNNGLGRFISHSSKTPASLNCHVLVPPCAGSEFQ
jgi:hypothetical protein